MHRSRRPLEVRGHKLWRAPHYRTTVHLETVVPFIIETFDKPEHQAVRKAARATHLEFLDQNKNLLLACGAKLADDGTYLGGGLYVVALETREEAQRFIESDPFHAAGLFERVTLTRWRKAYVDGQCFL